MEPFEFNMMYSGTINNETFTIIHNKDYNTYTEEYDETLQVIWDKSKPEGNKTYEQAIKKLFRSRLENDERVKR